jgi:hopanoid biosynthesis associated protein HpnK
MKPERQKLKQLIITADDFGLSRGVNAAVEKGWRDGILTCTSIMPAGAAFGEAVKIARRNPALQVGLHLTLLQGQSVLPHAQIPDLVNEAGEFSDNPVATGMRYFFHKGLYKQLKREIEAQIERVIDSGIPLSHIDGHLNIHLHPTVFAFLTDLMPRYGISSFRLSRERLFHNLRFDQQRPFGKSAERVIFGALAGHARPLLDRLGIRYADEVKGVLNSGRMTETYLLNIIDGLDEGLTELYFHPGQLPDAEITRRMPDYRHEEELAAIISPRIRNKLAEAHFGLCNYRGETKEYA